MPEGYKHFSKTKPMMLSHFNPVVAWWNNREAITVDDFPKAAKFTPQELAEQNYNLDQCGYPHEEEEILAPLDLIRHYEEKRSALNGKIDQVLEQITTLLGGDAQ